MIKNYNYLARCDDFSASNVEELNRMTESAVDSSYAAMARQCNGLTGWARRTGYSARELPLRNDWHVSYHRSRIFDRPCYFLRWSAFEVIWVKGSPNGLMSQDKEVANA